MCFHTAQNFFSRLDCLCDINISGLSTGDLRNAVVILGITANIAITINHAPQEKDTHAPFAG